MRICFNCVHAGDDLKKMEENYNQAQRQWTDNMINACRVSSFKDCYALNSYSYKCYGSVEVTNRTKKAVGWMASVMMQYHDCTTGYCMDESIAIQ